MSRIRTYGPLWCWIEIHYKNEHPLSRLFIPGNVLQEDNYWKYALMYFLPSEIPQSICQNRISSLFCSLTELILRIRAAGRGDNEPLLKLKEAEKHESPSRWSFRSCALSPPPLTPQNLVLWLCNIRVRLRNILLRWENGKRRSRSGNTYERERDLYWQGQSRWHLRQAAAAVDLSRRSVQA